MDLVLDLIYDGVVYLYRLVVGFAAVALLFLLAWGVLVSFVAAIALLAWWLIPW